MHFLKTLKRDDPCFKTAISARHSVMNFLFARDVLFLDSKDNVRSMMSLVHGLQ